ncbi:MAG: DUF2220 domain-containing protein [Gammaproteobacteria bacterium]|nr:DUF2220 domain-containing protein [Gammaproteobacteria bacterium]
MWQVIFVVSVINRKTLEDIARLNIDVKRVIIVENLQTGLALEDMPNTIVFMGLGYAVDIFQHILFEDGLKYGVIFHSLWLS